MVSCDQAGVIFTDMEGARYAVNGLAITHNPELPRINRIWAPAPEDPALRMDISPVLIGPGALLIDPRRGRAFELGFVTWRPRFGRARQRASGMRCWAVSPYGCRLARTTAIIEDSHEP